MPPFLFWEVNLHLPNFWIYYRIQLENLEVSHGHRAEESTPELSEPADQARHGAL
jgi:hypothetical protein